MKSKLPVIALLLIVLSCGYALMPSNAYACSCAGPGTPQDGLQMAGAVFAGKVLNITQTAQPYSQHRVLFEVISTWKGDVGREVIITTAGNSAACGYEFSVGSTYLVYASSYADRVSIGIGSTSVDLPFGMPELTTGMCSRTSLLADAAHDLAVLGAGNPPVQDSFLEKLKDFLPYLLLASLLAIGLLAYRRSARLKARGHSD